MRIERLEQAVETLRAGYEELRMQVAELREMVIAAPVDPLEGGFQSFKGRVEGRVASGKVGK